MLMICNFCGEAEETVVEVTKRAEHGRAHLKRCETDVEHRDWEWEYFDDADVLDFFEEAGPEKTYNVGVIRWVPQYKLFEAQGRTEAEAKKNAIQAGMEEVENPTWNQDDQKEFRYDTDDCEEAK